MEAWDHDAVVAALSPDVVLISPIFEKPFKGVPIEGIDLLRFDDQGRVIEITVFFRPFRGVAEFLSVTGPKLARRRKGAGTALAIGAAGMPLSALMKTTAATGPKLLGLKSAGE